MAKALKSENKPMPIPVLNADGLLPPGVFD
jgi:hypothetical protein